MKATLTSHPALQNMFGPLPVDIRQRLQRMLTEPRKYWPEDNGIILRDGPGFGLGLTLWQAIRAVDPTFPNVGPSTDGKGNVTKDWARYPDQVLVGRALRYAASAKGAR